MIYQVENGSDNTGKIPKGGVIVQGSAAGSMGGTIANPITYYGGISAVINQGGHSRDLYDYYWSSYSRGTDGIRNTKWHNDYLDGYIPLRVKSIYDPCPYLYRIPSNGSWNQFRMQSGWTANSYIGGAGWNMATLGESWFLGLGGHYGGLGAFWDSGRAGWYYSSTAGGQTSGYSFLFYFHGAIYQNYYDSRSHGYSVRCIERVNVTFVAPKRT